MSTPEPTDTNPRPRRHHAPISGRVISPRAAGTLAVVAVAVFGVEALAGERSSGAPSSVEDAPAVSVAAAPATVVSLPDLEGCTLDARAVDRGDAGAAVECVQKALTVAGHYTGPIDGTFSDELSAAASSFQTERGLYVDGIVGRNTAEALGIWPGDESFIVRTPPPEPGTYDSTGYELSSVASEGDDAPPLPDGANQASGKRVVYYRAGQRVWAIDDDEDIVRSYLVSGSQFNNEVPGVYEVYSKSEAATGWNLEADLPYMIRYLDTERGAIGFHEIPIRKDTGKRYQTEAELGTRLSGGCQRQAPLDALFLWNFADVGTTVIVI